MDLLVLNNCIAREHFSTIPIDFEQKSILIQSLNERDLIVNKNKNKLISLNSLFRYFYFYVHNKMYIYMKENQHYTHIYFIHQHIYVYKIKNIDGKQQLNKCKIYFVKKKSLLVFTV